MNKRERNTKPFFLQDVDGRSIQARRWRSIYDSILSEASALVGGEEHVSEAHKLLLQRVTAMSFICEEIDAQAANGQVVDAGLYCRLSNSIGRIMERLGVPDVINAPPDESLEEYLSKGKGRAELREGI